MYAEIPLTSGSKQFPFKISKFFLNAVDLIETIHFLTLYDNVDNTKTVSYLDSNETYSFKINNNDQFEIPGIVVISFNQILKTLCKVSNGTTLSLLNFPEINSAKICIIDYFMLV